MSNKRIDFTQLGGFPLTQDALDFMQQAYQEAIAGLAKLAGDAVIVSGMTDNGSAVTDGWILYNGELLPFAGGNKQTYFIITDTTGTETFEDDSVKTVYHTRQAKFGSGSGQIAYSSLTRLDSIKALQSGLNGLSTSLDNLSNALTAHKNDVANPHAVTKSQVGLSNIPNAISDSYSFDNSNTLATSKAVNDAFKSQKVIKAGSQYLGDIPSSDTTFTINHNAGITGSYVAICTLRSSGTGSVDNDVIFVTSDLTSNSFKIVTHELVTHTQALYLDYVLIKV